ncbi:hypothetical protein G7Y89_g8350 [Cudoniella acicularis]|uniref:Uncharacterized protein n=1 Tax=Cudoniella acicularis TaxID=354080 RepID=A0A8H4RHM7_9HELO|nr:hypothetical protein G7Y89_g8350 [Cudoniella acicularis]
MSIDIENGSNATILENKSFGQGSPLSTHLVSTPPDREYSTPETTRKPTTESPRLSITPNGTFSDSCDHSIESALSFIPPSYLNTFQLPLHIPKSSIKRDIPHSAYFPGLALTVLEAPPPPRRVLNPYPISDVQVLLPQQPIPLPVIQIVRDCPHEPPHVLSSKPPSDSKSNVHIIQTPTESYQIVVDHVYACPGRPRSPGASARFRQRRKEKEKEAMRQKEVEEKCRQMQVHELHELRA